MKQEEKELLLKDLCARLPYKVKVFYEYVDSLNNKTYGYSLTLNTWCINELEAEKATIKPYLRPMSSMTEEECDEWAQCEPDEWGINSIDWLNRKMFDYRNLIEKGLAIKASKETYNIHEDKNSR